MSNVGTGVIDLFGKRFGHLVVTGKPERRGRRDYFWPCLCDCGRTKSVRGTHLRFGRTKSCGCVHGIEIAYPIAHEQLTRMVRYDPKSGHFYWLVPSRKYRAGDTAEKFNASTGYLTLTLGKHIYNAHVLAYFYMRKVWPADGVDHKDVCRNNCRWENLRAANQSQNIANSFLSRASTTGFKGVSQLGENRFRAYVQGRHIGVFATALDAAKAYDAEAEKRFGEFARTNFGERRARME